MKINRAFIKGTNWALAGLLSMLGFTGCILPQMEYGTPNAKYTVKGTVVNKADGKPIEGIRVGYSSAFVSVAMYGTLPASYTPKTYVTTNSKGEFNLADRYNNVDSLMDNNGQVPVYVEDIDGEKNGLFQSDTLKVDFSETTIVTVNVELNEIKDQ